jgi:hypothetical protein
MHLGASQAAPEGWLFRGKVQPKSKVTLPNPTPTSEFIAFTTADVVSNRRFLKIEASIVDVWGGEWTLLSAIVHRGHGSQDSGHFFTVVAEGELLAPSATGTLYQEPLYTVYDDKQVHPAASCAKVTYAMNIEAGKVMVAGGAITFTVVAATYMRTDRFRAPPRCAYLAGHTSVVCGYMLAATMPRDTFNSPARPHYSYLEPIPRPEPRIQPQP